MFGHKLLYKFLVIPTWFILQKILKKFLPRKLFFRKLSSRKLPLQNCLLEKFPLGKLFHPSENWPRGKVEPNNIPHCFQRAHIHKVTYIHTQKWTHIHMKLLSGKNSSSHDPEISVWSQAIGCLILVIKEKVAIFRCYSKTL